MSDHDVEPRRPGRRTKAEEVAEALRELGIDPDADPAAGDAMPETFAEMRDGFMELIWQQRASLKGTALVSALRALAELAKANPDGDSDSEQPTVAETIAGIPGLSAEKRDEILRRELAKLDDERAAIQGVLDS